MGAVGTGAFFRVRFLGRGEVFLNGERLEFPYRKVRLLLFALLEARSLERGGLCEGLWGGRPGTAAANLRNALSALRRLLPDGCVVADRRAGTLQLADDVRVASDLEELEALDAGNVERLSRPFLEDEGSEPENGWLRDCRARYGERLRLALEAKARAAPPDERAFWSALAEERRAGLGGRTFRMPLVRDVERDAVLAFFEDAGREVSCSCAVVLGDDGSGKSALASDLFRRMGEKGCRCLRERLEEGDEDERRCLGSVLNALLDGRNLSALPPFYARFLRSACPGLEPGQDSLSGFPCSRDIPGLAELNPYLAGKISALLLAPSAGKGRDRRDSIFLLLENVHWGERLVPDFLRGVFENLRAPLSVLLTCRPEFRRALSLVLPSHQDRLKRRDFLLERLDPVRTAELCRLALPSRSFTPEELEAICRRTEGSAFLLREFLSFRHAEAQDAACPEESLYEIVHRRTLALAEPQSRLLDCLALFPGAAPFERLRRLCALDEDGMIALCGQLERRRLIQVRRTDALADPTFLLSFCHPLLKKRIREAMPRLRRWSLSRRLLADLEEHPGSRFDGRRLPGLARNAGAFMAELKARVRELRTHFEFSHELFPRLSDAELSSAARVDDTSLTQEYLDEAWGLLDRLIRAHGRTPELIRHERTLLTLRGGFLRWSGRYADAGNCLDEAMRLALHAPDRREAVVDVLEQFCCIGIQRDAPETLRRYVFAFYREVRRAQLHPQIGMALRFLSVLGLMEGRFGDAAKMARMSLRLFEKLEAHGNGHTLGVVAAMHSHGDLALYQGRHREALGHYMQCVRLCEGKGFYRGLGLPLSKAAWCSARLGEWEEARGGLDFARTLFEGFRSRRGAGLCGGEIAFGLSALLALWDGRSRAALENLRRAEALSSVLRKPLWNAMLLCVKSALKRRGDVRLEGVLAHGEDVYEAEARRLFGRLGMPQEAAACRQFREGGAAGPGS